MNRFARRSIAAMAVAFLLARCSTGTEPFVVLVDLSVDSAVVYLGDSLHVDLAAVGANGDTVPDAQVKLVSSDSSVAVMGTDGWVHGLGSGFATIRASDGQANDSVAITVTPRLVFRSITAGEGYACGVTMNGIGYCWGAWQSTIVAVGKGRLGSGDTVSHLLPTRVAGGLQFSVIQAEESHTCALTVNGDAYCWGEGGAGQLGTAPLIAGFHSAVPIAVQGGLHFTAIELGLFHTCALTGAGAAYCWGSNASGEIGDSTNTMRVVPVSVVGGLKFASLSAGDRHTCGVTVDSLPYCWGWNSHGQLGDSTTIPARQYPGPVHTNLLFTAIAASSHAFSCAVAAGNSAYCWGHNDTYQLGRAPNVSTDLPVLPVSGGQSFTSVSLGGLESCGLTPTGAAYCWGATDLMGYPGALGGYSDIPLPIAGGLTFTTLSVGNDFACGMATDGRAYCWGENRSGQVGNGRASPLEATPVPVIGQP